MIKKTLLTKNVVKDFGLEPRVKELINKYKTENNLENQQINILDWGCGMGKEVLRLRDNGYTAFGVEINEKLIKKNLPFFINRGYNSSILQAVSEDNKTNFPDEYFDIILSNQVFEHIEDMESVLAEMKRITKKNGVGYHRFPAHKKIKEVHLRMPFVHWLPKNRLREFLITVFVLIGIEPKWRKVKGKSLRDKVAWYYQYSIQSTFYRNISTLVNLGTKAGFDVRFDVHINPKIRNRKLLKGLFSTHVFNLFIKAIYNRFRRVELILVKKS